MFIKNYGLFWKRDAVWWGQQGDTTNPGNLLGVLEHGQDAINFHEQIGFYALYDIHDNRDIRDTRDVFTDAVARAACDTPYDNRDKLIYCGHAGVGEEQTLFERIRQHQQPAERLYEKWNQFSWFGIGDLAQDNSLSYRNPNVRGTRVDFLRQMEAVMIAISRPIDNRLAGNFGNGTQYLQFRDPILDANN